MPGTAFSGAGYAGYYCCYSIDPTVSELPTLRLGLVLDQECSKGFLCLLDGLFVLRSLGI